MFVFFLLDVLSCDLDCLLNILKTHELKNLQKEFNINSTSSRSQTKPEMIKSFINLVKNQRTFCGNSSTNLKKWFVYYIYFLVSFRITNIYILNNNFFILALKKN